MYSTVDLFFTWKLPFDKKKVTKEKLLAPPEAQIEWSLLRKSAPSFLIVFVSGF